jgi:hypothetical protein
MPGTIRTVKLGEIPPENKIPWTIVQKSQKERLINKEDWGPVKKASIPIRENK